MKELLTEEQNKIQQKSCLIEAFLSAAYFTKFSQVDGNQSHPEHTKERCHHNSQRSKAVLTQI